MLEACSTAGVTLGPLVGEAVVRHTATLAAAWRILVLGCCAVYAGCGLVRWLFLREVPAGPREAGSLNIPWKPLAVPMIVTAAWFAGFAFTTDGPVMGPYIVDVTKGTPETVQEVGFYGGLVAMAGAVGAGIMADRFGAGRTMALATIGTVALLAPFVLGVPGPSVARAIFALLFLTGEVYVVAYQKLVTSIGPRERRGLAIGIVGTVVGLVASWAMVLAGRFYAAGPQRPLVAAAAVHAAAAIFALLLFRRAFNPRGVK